MKKLVLAVLAMALISTGCSKFSALTPWGNLDTETGNKVVIYHDIDMPGGGEDTTIAVIRLEDNDTAGCQLKGITQEVVKVFKVKEE